MLRAVLAALALTLPALASAEPVIAIDAGHGGKQEGAVGPKQQKEKDVALAIAKRLRIALLRKWDVRVAMTREKDVEVDLDDRIKLANDSKADLFVSLHCNSMPTRKTQRTAHGIETYFLSAEETSENAKNVVARENADGKKKAKARADLSFILSDLARTEAHHDASKLAYFVQKKLVDGLEANDRGVHQGAFVVLMGATMPAVLVEVGFISHPDESKQLNSDSYQQKLADSLAESLVGFLDANGTKVAVKEAAAVEPATTETAAKEE